MQWLIFTQQITKIALCISVYYGFLLPNHIGRRQSSPRSSVDHFPKRGVSSQIRSVHHRVQYIHAAEITSWNTFAFLLQSFSIVWRLRCQHSWRWSRNAVSQNCCVPPRCQYNGKDNSLGNQVQGRAPFSHCDLHKTMTQRLRSVR